MDDTIAALSSPPGASARAVVRLSGPRAWDLAAGVFAPWPARPWTRASGALRLPGWPEAPAVALGFRAPRSYTGQDAVELWVPGAPPLVRRLLLVLAELGARPAGPGEFTRRAFLAGRLDLTQAEAVLALTTAEDAAGLRAALRALEGGVRGRVDALKAALLDVLAHVEAAIDFADEDIDHLPGALLAARLEAALEGVRALLRDDRARPQAGAAPTVALVGAANAGKSSLLNALAGAPVALVSPVAGTTRDVVAASWRLPSGAVVRLLDTAGEKEARGAIEAEALDRARAAAASADLVLHVVDGMGGGEEPPGLVVVTKSDLGPSTVEGDVRTSAVTGEGLDALARLVERALFGGPGGPGADLVGSARQEALLRVAGEAIARASELIGGSDPARAELASVDLGAALEALGELTGAVTNEDVLDRVFGQFCIGK
jgi:tRNA modification GTPase